MRVDTPFNIGGEDYTFSSSNPYPHKNTTVAMTHGVLTGKHILHQMCGSDGAIINDQRLKSYRQVEEAFEWANRHRKVWSEDTYIVVYRRGIARPICGWKLGTKFEEISYE